MQAYRDHSAAYHLRDRAMPPGKEVVLLSPVQYIHVHRRAGHRTAVETLRFHLLSKGAGALAQ